MRKECLRHIVTIGRLPFCICIDRTATTDLGPLGENTVPTFGDENGDFLSTSAPGCSGVHARRKTQLEIYRHVKI
jgi:hypothetical protein|tara:strand:+ start:145 stop:369 length:225 start_codon:yes stop_codon:yes gene_type:complete